MEPADDKIFVTRPFLPPLEELTPLLEQIWDARVLTNGGPFHARLESELCEYLGVPEISLFSNGTIALITALQALDVRGEVVTTPYSFVATSHSLLWNRNTPVFVDIDPHSFNLDPAKIEAAITPQTSAILAVHCYGHPCDTAGIQAVADAHGLKVIYDAAHAFGVRDAGGSILRHGDLSTLSFHATKVFNTFEGGAIVSGDSVTKDLIDRLKNFGHEGETVVTAAGINGKLNEFSAALGLVQLGHIQEVVAERGRIDARYRSGLAGVAGIRCLGPSGEITPNYSYFPIVVDDAYPEGRDELVERLKSHGVFPRKYFYPLISQFPMYRGLPSADPDSLPVASDAAARVLCLPIYPELSDEDVDRIIRLIAGE